MDHPADIGPSPVEDDSSDGEPPPRLSLEIVVERGDWPPEEEIERLVGEVAGALEREPVVACCLGPAATACIAFAGDADVRVLNKRYRAKDKPTNVLSFPAPPSPGAARDGEPRNLGDVVLAAETVAGAPREAGTPFAHHLQHLVLHGVLHLLGHDHETDGEAEAMEALETRILATLGVADPYRSNE